MHRGVACSRPAFREYIDVDQVRRAFCNLAGHAFGTVEQHPALPGSERRVTA